MEMEKKRSKGSFLSLFDWNSKSRKKLIWNSPTLPEVSKQGKENVENLPKSQVIRIKVDENGASTSNFANCDFNCTLSVYDEEGCGSKAPGLVARLMGLDSLPASAVTELSYNSLYGSNSRGSSRCNESLLHSMNDFHPADYINMPSKVEKSSFEAMELRAHKADCLPMKRFQTEMLPPKSAKPIPVTHNKLLSPIKCPGFLPPRNADHIMEAAAKIIEASPRPHIRNRMPTVGPSSALRILDLKERLEAAQHASMPENLMGPSNSHHVNGKPSQRNSNFNKCTSAFKGSRDSEKNSSCHSTSTGKSASLAIQAKINVQSRDTLISNSNRKYMKQKEQNEMKSKQLSRSQKPSTHQVLQQRTYTGRVSNVLAQNNQKQNSLTTKGKSALKSDSNKPTTRASPSESSTGIRKATNKGIMNANVQTKRSRSTRATDNQKGFPQSKIESASQKKKYISRDVHEARGPDNAVNNLDSKSIKYNFTTDGSMDQDVFKTKESKDVISFTFTSPLRRSMPESPSSTEQVMEARTRIGFDPLGHNGNLFPKKSSLSPPGLHMFDGDALSVLLEKKLQELTSRINLPQCDLVTEASSTGLRHSLTDKVPSLVSTSLEEQSKNFYPGLLSDDNPVLNMNQQLQASEVKEDPSGYSNSESGNDLDCQHSGAVSVLETSFVSESYLDSEDSTCGSTIYCSMQDEVSNFSQINKSVSLANEDKWSEQASSMLVCGNIAMKQTSETSDLVDFNIPSKELQYVLDILVNANFMADEFFMGQTDMVIAPNLFYLLENQSNGTENRGEEYSKLERKVLFDFVSECLELRCRRAFARGCKGWRGWVTSVQRKSWLAEELYKEMLGFRSLEEAMVDELVSKDMSTVSGKWLDFEVEAFEEGLDVEEDILDYLINDLVSDLLLA